LIDLRAMSV